MVALALLLFASTAEPSRVADARARIGAELKAAVEARHVHYPPRAVLLRSFKHEGSFEVWIGDDVNKPLVLLEAIPICASSGVLGPKRQQGDRQVPEGIYQVDRLNPTSTFHLALHVDYPNRADRMAGKARGTKDLGGDIMVHGSCVTIGCIPLQDGPIERVYLLVNDARAAGAVVPIHIFPRKLDAEGKEGASESTDDVELRAFWTELSPIAQAFDDTHVVPRVRVDAHGHYTLAR